VKFARNVFIGAGLWGIGVLVPLFFHVDVSGRVYQPPADYPNFFYGFIVVGLAWQIAFLVIGSNPARFRALMVPAIVEKLGYVATLAVLYAQGRIGIPDAQAGIPDGLLGLLFVVSFFKTRGAAVREGP
jgi:hypothetical protein